MLTCFCVTPNEAAIPLEIIEVGVFEQWLAQQAEAVQNWVKATGFNARPETFCLLNDGAGRLTKVLVGADRRDDFWVIGGLPQQLPVADYQLVNTAMSSLVYQHHAMAWGLGSYQFVAYKKPLRQPARLVLTGTAAEQAEIIQLVKAVWHVRNWINTPTEHMGPEHLTDLVHDVAKPFAATVTEIVGEDLLAHNFPLIHTVGRASHRAPRLIDLHWGKLDAPKLTLVGKGVCFDSGGLDIKTAPGMQLMKKDMAGAAHVLGLAYLIMSANLPVRLRVLIPAVENAISGNAYRPGDIIRSRAGLTVEIGNTDAEGRLLLADALTEAATETPALLINFATLTGAARVALGTDLTALFTDQDDLAKDLLAFAQREQDPCWQMPIYAPYRKLLDSPYADINNASSCPYGGAITAALFLREFVPRHIPWVHFDLMAWNLSTRPGRPEGGEAMMLRAIYAYLRQRFAPQA